MRTVDGGLSRPLPDVVEVEYLEGHRLALTFSTGERGEVDLGQDIGAQPQGLLRDLQDERYFAQVFVDSETGTIA